MKLQVKSEGGPEEAGIKELTTNTAEFAEIHLHHAKDTKEEEELKDTHLENGNDSGALTEQVSEKLID